jgi:hypothetical protein
VIEWRGEGVLGREVALGQLGVATTIARWLWPRTASCAVASPLDRYPWDSWLARKDSNLPSPDPENSGGSCGLSVLFERGADSISVDPAGNQVEHVERSQVNVVRSSNSGIDRIALDDGWEGEWFPLFPLTPQVQLTRRAEMSIWQSGSLQSSMPGQAGESSAALTP